eukprot:3204274-Pyramimonas_sp.AAC.1
MMSAWGILLSSTIGVRSIATTTTTITPRATTTPECPSSTTAYDGSTSGSVIKIYFSRELPVSRIPDSSQGAYPTHADQTPRSSDARIRPGA